MKRFREGLLMKTAARTLGVSPYTVSNWEHGRTRPRVDHYGRVVAFLSYDSHDEGDGLAGQMLAFRRRRGLSQRAAAKALGVDPVTWWSWETGKRHPVGSRAERLRALLDGS